MDLKQRLLATVEEDGYVFSTLFAKVPFSLSLGCRLGPIPVNFRNLPGWDPHPQAKQVTLNLPHSFSDVLMESVVGNYALFAIKVEEGLMENSLYHWPTSTLMMVRNQSYHTYALKSHCSFDRHGVAPAY